MLNVAKLRHTRYSHFSLSLSDFEYLACPDHVLVDLVPSLPLCQSRSCWRTSAPGFKSPDPTPV